MQEVNVYVARALDYLMDYGLQLLLAMLVLVVGWWIIRVIVRITEKAMDRANVDLSLHKFLSTLIGVLLKILLFISAASMIGIEMTSFIAIIGAAGLAVALALQGSMSNFAGGVLLLLFKPFRIGDTIDAQGYLGKVHLIHVLHTTLKTFDNKTIIIPNGALANGSITNYSVEENRRVDMSFGISYDDNIKLAKEILQKLVSEDERVMADPVPLVAVSELGESSINFVVRVWCNAAEYWNVFYAMQENVKLAFDQAGISIPFPQRDVHLYQEKTNV